MPFIKFFMSRLLVFLLVVFIGITTVFLLPRFLPSDPVESVIAQIQTNSSFMDPESVQQMRQVLSENFGLSGSLWEQYTRFLKRAFLTFDFGPSLSMYPTPVVELIGNVLPWTMGLLLTSTFISWIIGNIIGLLAGFRPEKTSSKVLEGVAIFLYPQPYYVFALLLIMLFSYLWPVFPLSTVVRGEPWTLEFIKSVLYNSFLPAMSMILIGTGWWVLSMKTLAMSVAEEDYVHFAKLKGLSRNRIMTKYVMRNALLPQITTLSLQLGGIFSGAIVTEILFSYPGVGTLIYNAILQSDYNLIIGTISLSIIAISAATFLIDMLYPFLDPRIRYK